jgi:hypothetical protein
LEIRAEAMLRLIAKKEVEPDVGLALVVWPTRSVAEASETAAGTDWPAYDEQTKRKALDLLSAGLSQGETAEELGTPRSTIQQWQRKARA